MPVTRILHIGFSFEDQTTWRELVSIMMVELNGNVIAEEVDGEILVCDLNRSLVHRLDCESADLLRTLRTSPLGTVPMDESDALGRLIDLGVVRAKTSDGDSTLVDRTLSRRRVMGLTAAATAAGVITLALPDAAAASSAEGFGDVGDNPYSISNSSSFQIDNPTIFRWSNAVGQLRISWDPEGTIPPGTFTYKWQVRSGSFTGPILADGQLTSSSSASGVLFTASPGQTIYVRAASNTTPVFVNSAALTRNP